jgi:hypothetical protein
MTTTKDADAATRKPPVTKPMPARPIIFSLLSSLFFSPKKGDEV